jgi:phosphatidylserine decarboxylase
LPKKALTQFGGLVAGAQMGAVTQGIIRWFIQRYGVNMAEAANPDPNSYASFNEFFTRALKPDGRIEKTQIFQAKGHSYSAQALVGGDADLAAQFTDGHFACIYLSPKDYHRIHMPCAGTLRQMVYVPGDLFSVNPSTARGVPGLFARNERVVCVFDTPLGPFVNVLVGATIVGSMPHSSSVNTWRYEDGSVTFKQGDEMGRFLLGSTVVMLWPKSDLAFNPQWSAGQSIRLGENMATLV